MLPINERNRRVFFPFYFDALKIPLISIKNRKRLTQMVLNIAKPLMFNPILDEDDIALGAELLGYETYRDAWPIELNPVVLIFQRLSAQSVRRIWPEKRRRRLLARID